ncbi:MAG: hypothetical protein RIR39_807 [Pseudomonadota bacterium]|jgi:hypothetical protein
MDAMTIIEQYSFSKYADIIRNSNGEIKFSKVLSTELPDFGYVYLWLELDDHKKNIVYVGKAGKKMSNRCSQHEAGFKTSSPGKKHKQRILEGMESKKTYSVYCRKAPIQMVLDEFVCMLSAEEEALIKKINPQWNS